MQTIFRPTIIKGCTLNQIYERAFVLNDNNYAFGKSDALNESKILRNNLSKKFQVLYARKKKK